MESDLREAIRNVIAAKGVGYGATAEQIKEVAAKVCHDLAIEYGDGPSEKEQAETFTQPEPVR